MTLATLRRPLLLLAVAAALAALLLQLAQLRLASAWFGVATQGEVLAELERSLADQKELARLDPARGVAYRERFDELEALTRRLKVLERSREAVVRRYQALLLAAFAAAVAGAAVALALRQRRAEARRARQRAAALADLTAWQEAARRHAHEMRTPLTAARLELAALGDRLDGEPALADGAGLRAATGRVVEELERLARFSRELTSFARLPPPRLAVEDLVPLVGAFAAAFAAAWPNLDLALAPAAGLRAAVDRDLLRQVLVNLCDNSSRALAAGARGTVRFHLAAAGKLIHLDVADDGPGLAAGVRARLFEPYTTTRSLGEGMGLGLAISRKILLDHGGDLELVPGPGPGTVFRLTLTAVPAEGAP